MLATAGSSLRSLKVKIKKKKNHLLSLCFGGVPEWYFGSSGIIVFLETVWIFPFPPCIVTCKWLYILLWRACRKVYSVTSGDDARSFLCWRSPKFVIWPMSWSWVGGCDFPQWSVKSEFWLLYLRFLVIDIKSNSST